MAGDPGRARSPRYKRSHHKIRTCPEAPRAVLSCHARRPVPTGGLRIGPAGGASRGARHPGRDPCPTCWKQAVFALAWFRDRPDIRRLGAGFGIPQATAYRYKDEAVEVLAAKAPSLREALDGAAGQGLAYLILDGTLISSDRCAGKKTSKKGKEIDAWYSGKAHEPAGNVQALAAPGGVPLWISDVLPGSTHDVTAARELVLPQARPYLTDLPFLADSGYEGAGAGVMSR